MSADLIDPSEFEELPRTEVEWRRQVWHRLARIEKQTITTNGRVSELEKYKWLALGGLTVLTAIVVPIFLSLVSA